MSNGKKKTPARNRKPQRKLENLPSLEGVAPEDRINVPAQLLYELYDQGFQHGLTAYALPVAGKRIVGDKTELEVALQQRMSTFTYAPRHTYTQLHIALQQELSK